MRVLVTGHRGYIGSVMTRVLRNARYDVIGLDCEWYEGCDFGRTHEDPPSFEFDLREVEFTDLLSVDAVIHLASLPEGLPASCDAGLVDEINVEATMRLAECCKRAQVERFLFASTCAVYGNGGSNALTENSPLDPRTAYAKSKRCCEIDLERLADSSFSPVLLRFGTAYGVSPRLRLDLVVNEFVAKAVTSGRLEMQTAGRAWRPLVHVEDIARCCASLLSADDRTVCGRTLNIGPNGDNHRIIDVADVVAEEVPRAIRIPRDDVFDDRSYRVDGSKLLDTLPGFQFRWTLRKGVRQLRAALECAGLTSADLRLSRYRRIDRLVSLVERGGLDGRLRRRTPAASRL